MITGQFGDRFGEFRASSLAVRVSGRQESRTMIKAAILMTVYAFVLLGLGGLAYTVAPPDANALTALAVPGGFAVLMLVAAVMTVLGRGASASGKPKPLGMIGVHAGLAFPLLFVLAFAGRAVPLTTRFLDARAATSEQDVAEQLAQEVLDPDDAAETRDTLSKDYLLMTLWGGAGMSVIAFTGLALLRPKPSASSKAD